MVFTVYPKTLFCCYPIAGMFIHYWSRISTWLRPRFSLIHFMLNLQYYLKHSATSSTV